VEEDFLPDRPVAAPNRNLQNVKYKHADQKGALWRQYQETYPGKKHSCDWHGAQAADNSNVVGYTRKECGVIRYIVL